MSRFDAFQFNEMFNNVNGIQNEKENDKVNDIESFFSFFKVFSILLNVIDDLKWSIKDISTPPQASKVFFHFPSFLSSTENTTSNEINRKIARKQNEKDEKKTKIDRVKIQIKKKSGNYYDYPRQLSILSRIFFCILK